VTRVASMSRMRRLGLGELPPASAGLGPGFTHFGQVLFVEGDVVGGHCYYGNGDVLGDDEVNSLGAACSVGGHGAEAHLLVPQSGQVAERIAAIGQHDPEISQDLSRMVLPPAPAQVGEGRDECACETRPRGLQRRRSWSGRRHTGLKDELAHHYRPDDRSCDAQYCNHK